MCRMPSLSSLDLKWDKKKKFKENPCLQEKCSTVLALPLMFDEVVCIEDKRQFTPDAILGNFMTLRVRETG